VKSPNVLSRTLQYTDATHRFTVTSTVSNNGNCHSYYHCCTPATAQHSTTFQATTARTL